MTKLIIENENTVKVFFYRTNEGPRLYLHIRHKNGKNNMKTNKANKILVENDKITETVRDLQHMLVHLGVTTAKKLAKALNCNDRSLL